MQAEQVLTLKEIVFLLAFVASNAGTFYATKAATKKVNTESDSLNVDIVNKLYKAYEEMRKKEDEMFRAKRLVDTQLQDCLEGKQNCRECLGKIQNILSRFSEANDATMNQALLKDLIHLKQEMEDVQK